MKLVQLLPFLSVTCREAKKNLFELLVPKSPPSFRLSYQLCKIVDMSKSVAYKEALAHFTVFFQNKKKIRHSKKKNYPKKIDEQGFNMPKCV